MHSAFITGFFTAQPNCVASVLSVDAKMQNFARVRLRRSRKNCESTAQVADASTVRIRRTFLALQDGPLVINPGENLNLIEPDVLEHRGQRVDAGKKPVVNRFLGFRSVLDVSERMKRASYAADVVRERAWRRCARMVGVFAREALALGRQPIA